MVFKSNIRVTNCHALIDKGMDKLRNQSEQAGRPFTCSAGCSACCYEPVYADRREIEHALAGITNDELEQVTVQTRAWVALLGSAPILQDREPNAFEYRALRAACPFLGTNSRCMIYERRPSACRSHNAVGDPKNCHDEGLRKTQIFATSPELDNDLALITIYWLKGCDENHVGIWLAELLLKKKISSNALRRLSGSDIKRIGKMETKVVGMEI